VDYLEFLERLHAILQPRSYLEIGGDFGQSLAISRARTIAVDPQPSWNCDVTQGKPWIKIFRQKSDEFFHDHTAASILEGCPLDLVFLDGLHEFTQIVRDFANVEAWSHPGTVVVVHDVLPQDAWQATRQWHEGAWTGDVWRLVPFLRQHRPDLRCDLIDVAPTGALVVTNLDPAHQGMAALAELADRDFPDDGEEYAALLHALCPARKPIGYRVEHSGSASDPTGENAGGTTETGAFQVLLDEPVRAGHAARLVLRATGMDALRIRLDVKSASGLAHRDIVLDVTHPGAAHHDLDLLRLGIDPAAGAFMLDWEGSLRGGESLTGLSLAPIDYWLKPVAPGPETAIALEEFELTQIPIASSRARFAPSRFPDEDPAPKRKRGERDAVVFAWWIPGTPTSHAVADYYLGLLRYHYADSKIFVGVNHGSDPGWTDALLASGLDIEIAHAPPHIRVTSDVGGFLAALGAYARHPEEFDLVWFGHTKGASRRTYSEYLAFRYQHDRRFWARRDDVDRIFGDPDIGLFSHRYGLSDSSPDATRVPWRGLGEIDALQRVYRHTFAPLGLWAWETVFVMRDSIVRQFCRAVGPDFFLLDPARYGAGRWWFEAAFPSIASMQGFEPFIELDTDGPGDPREDVVLYRDPKQGNRLAMQELERWRRDRLAFVPRGLPRSF
jgi:hypothetical protein